MALETLKGIETIGGFDVIDMDALKEKYPERFTHKNEKGEITSQMDYKWFESEIRPNNFVYIRHDVNSISFTLQNGAIQENGVNGCQLETLIDAARLIIIGLNAKHSCRENCLAITKLEEALHWLEARTKDRKKRGVEGHQQD